MTGFLKFGAASAIGFVVDLILALALHEALALPLWLAATVSFFTVAFFNYLLFEFWVFQTPGRGASLRRAGGVILGSLFAAGTRIATILLLAAPVTAALGTVRPADTALLVAGAGVSLVVNFLFNRFVVFPNPVHDGRDR